MIDIEKEREEFEKAYLDKNRDKTYSWLVKDDEFKNYWYKDVREAFAMWLAAKESAYAEIEESKEDFLNTHDKKMELFVENANLKIEINRLRGIEKEREDFENFQIKQNSEIKQKDLTLVNQVYKIGYLNHDWKVWLAAKESAQKEIDRIIIELEKL